jgi:hypothetical protein
MTDNTQNRILRVTRWLVYLIMGLIASVGIVLAAVSVILPFYWDEAVKELLVSHPGMNVAELMPLLLAIFALGIVVLGLIWTVMRKLLAIIGSVEIGNPFILANAVRLKAIGWMMVVLHLIGIPLAILAGKAADMFGESDTGLDISLNSILSILLVFILAGIFERGAEMREELEGTV